MTGVCIYLDCVKFLVFLIGTDINIKHHLWSLLVLTVPLMTIKVIKVPVNEHQPDTELAWKILNVNLNTSE